jgi:site-specific recombinase XerD
MPKTDLEPVVTAMVSQWSPPSRSNWVATARRIVTKVLDWLQGQPGDDWQARWLASGAESHPRGWPALACITGRQQIDTADYVLNALIILRAITPSLGWLVGTPRLRLRDDWTTYHDAHVFAALRAKAEPPGGADRADSIAHLYRMSVTTGRGLPDLTAEDFRATRQALIRLRWRKGSLDTTWRHLRAVGLLQGEPDELSKVIAKSRLTPSELVDRYEVRAEGVRDLLVEYLTERESTCDYTTLTTIALHVVKLFWIDLETHEPGLQTLAISREQAQRWKHRLQILATGGQRRDWPAVAQNIRSFYLDLAAWSQDDPARWAAWVAPCPIGNRELRTLGTRRRRRQIAEMNARTRSLSPVLPQLVSSVTGELRLAKQRLQAASRADPGVSYQVGDEHWRKTPGPRRDKRQFCTGDVTAIDSAGRRINLTKAEDRAFWTWATVEVLRHTGIRIEELLELTHLSLRPFREPNGQIIPLLQIAPSKSDAERMLPVSPELAHVFSRIVLRHTHTGEAASDKSSPPTVPLVSRWDDHERVHSAPLPYLFQRGFLIGRRSVISPGTVRNWLTTAAADANLRDNDGTPLTFSPHDFRRIFLTDVVRNGLPIHIAAQLAGHDDLNTTRRYAATYPTEVIEHYQRFIARRRAERPVEEYRQPTDEELKEFGEHFGRRRVELGNCVRPYGTGCTHEHACIRCNFLQLEPSQADRLAQIESDLKDRIDTAREQSWLGDVEQLQLTLSHLHDKQDQAQRLLNIISAPRLITAAPTLSTSLT